LTLFEQHLSNRLAHCFKSNFQYYVFRFMHCLLIKMCYEVQILQKKDFLTESYMASEGMKNTAQVI